MVNEFKNAAGVTFPQGFKAAGVKAGIKKSGNLDVAVIYTEKEAVVAGTFTQNAVAAAPVFASKAVVATGTAHAIVEKGAACLMAPISRSTSAAVLRRRKRSPPRVTMKPIPPMKTF